MAFGRVNAVIVHEFSSKLVFPNNLSSPSSSCFLANAHSLSHSCLQISPLSSFSSFSLNCKLNHRLSASSQGPPSELDEDSKFVPLDAEDPSYGPPALLLVGFKLEEAEKIMQLLKDLEGEFLQIIYCTEDMITWSLWDAVSIREQNLERVKIAKSLPRICFLSGLSGEEMMMFIDAFEDIDLELPVFTAHVPNSSNKPLLEVIEEIMGDHEMMSAKQSDSE